MLDAHLLAAGLSSTQEIDGTRAAVGTAARDFIADMVEQYAKDWWEE